MDQETKKQFKRVDTKFDLGVEIDKRIDQATRKEEAFHSKLLAILKRNHLLQPADSQELEKTLS